MKKPVLLFLLLIIYFNSSGQNYTISGLIVDKKSGGKLVKVECYDKLSNKGTLTNKEGKYKLSLSKGKHIIIYKSLGYITQKKEFYLSKDTIINILFEPSLNDLQPVVIKSKRGRKKEVTMIKIKPEELKKMPSFIGQHDLMKIISFLTGIDNGKEGFSNIYVRGADRGQNAIYYNGIPLTNTNHLGGFLSIFDTDLLQDIKIYKDYIPGKFGGGLSSVIDINTKNKQPEKLKVHGDIGILISKIFAEIPINKKFSWYVSARTSYYDLFERRNKKKYKKTGKGSFLNYQVYDINSKFNYRLSKKNILSFSFYLSKDNQYMVDAEFGDSKTESRMKITNLGLSINNNHYFNKRISWHNKLTFSRYSFYSQDIEYENIINDLSIIDKLNYKVEKYNYKSIFDFDLSNFYDIQSGIEIIKNNYTPVYYTRIENQNTKTNYLFEQNSKLKPIEASFFVDNAFFINDKINLHLDFRSTLYHTTHCNYFRFEPRFMSEWNITKKLIASSGFIITNQFNHVFVNNYFGFEREFRLPAGNKYKPQQGYQIFSKIQKSYKNLELSLGAYYKKMNNLIFFHTGVQLNNLYSNFSDEINTGGVGSAYGLELELSSIFNNFSMGLSYTLSRSIRHFDNLNHNLNFPSTYDRLHNLDYNLLYKLNKSYTAGFHFVLKSGSHTTFPVAFVQSDDLFNGYFVYDKINNQQLPIYHRLDFSLTRTKINKNGKKNSVSLNIFNVYNRSNAVYIYYDYNSHKVKQKSLFPIMPTINISFDF